MYGLDSGTNCSGTGNKCTNQYGVYAYNYNLTANTTTNAYGGYFDFGTLLGSPSTGIITNGYGIYIGSILATHKYALYAADNTAPSYFAGSVGIGTLSPQYSLSVNGTIQAKEVLVNTNWSDYVFDPQYRLAPLHEVGRYIKANGHLPEIPSAAEVAANGVSLGEMQSKLLAKIEELTLHMIAADETNGELRKRISRLEAGGARPKTPASATATSTRDR